MTTYTFPDSCSVPATGWKDVWYCISPFSWGYVGVAMALFFSVMGAAWYYLYI